MRRKVWGELLTCVPNERVLWQREEVGRGGACDRDGRPDRSHLEEGSAGLCPLPRSLRTPKY